MREKRVLWRKSYLKPEGSWLQKQEIGKGEFPLPCFCLSKITTHPIELKLKLKEIYAGIQAVKTVSETGRPQRYAQNSRRLAEARIKPWVFHSNFFLQLFYSHSSMALRFRTPPSLCHMLMNCLLRYSNTSCSSTRPKPRAAELLPNVSAVLAHRRIHKLTLQL